MWHRSSSTKGFTLVEIIIVISIVSVIISIPVVTYNQFSRSSRDTQRISDLENINGALQLYRANNGVYPSANNLNLLVEQNYLTEIPVDGKDGEDGFGYTYESDLAGSTFTLSALLENGQYYIITPLGSIQVGQEEVEPTATPLPDVPTETPFPPTLTMTPTNVPSQIPTEVPTDTPVPVAYIPDLAQSTLDGLGGRSDLINGGTVYLTGESVELSALNVDVTQLGITSGQVKAKFRVWTFYEGFGDQFFDTDTISFTPSDYTDVDFSQPVDIGLYATSDPGGYTDPTPNTDNFYWDVAIASADESVISDYFVYDSGSSSNPNMIYQLPENNGTRAQYSSLDGISRISLADEASFSTNSMFLTLENFNAEEARLDGGNLVATFRVWIDYGGSFGEQFFSYQQTITNPSNYADVDFEVLVDIAAIAASGPLGYTDPTPNTDDFYWDVSIQKEGTDLATEFINFEETSNEKLDFTYNTP